MAVLRILVADDVDKDLESLKAAFSRAGVKTSLNFVRNAKAAIDYLKGAGDYANRWQYPLPSLLLLGLNMPARDGFGVLEWLRLHSDLRRPLVVVFSSSDQPDHIKRAHDLGANSYLLKPSAFEELAETVREAESHWIRFNLLPLPGGLHNSHATAGTHPAQSRDTKVIFRLGGPRRERSSER